MSIGISNFDCFDELDDPRVVGRCDYSLKEIIAISICAVICGYDTWKHIAMYAEAKQEWLKTWLPLKKGVPTQHTFGRVFALLDPKAFEEGFAKWIAAACELTDGAIVAIDGKTLRRSHDRKNNKAAVHMVSAWAHENGLVLAQVKTDDKSNEITAIPELLEKLNLSGCIVTIDAMGCQKGIAEKVIDQDADYVICLKGNQSKLRAHVEATADEVIGEDFDCVKQAHVRRIDESHGRREVRDYWMIEDDDITSPKADWPGLRSYGVVRSEVTVDGKTSVDTRYFISSLPCAVKDFARAVRTHWSIENSLHWCLDVTFREDESRIRVGHAPENMAVIRRLSLSALKQTPPPPRPPRSPGRRWRPSSTKPQKMSVNAKRKLCSLDDHFFSQVLARF